jgi:hypothetical protein
VFKYLTFTKASGTGPQTISGVGFAGLALMLWSTRQTASGATDGATLTVSITDGAQQGTRFIRHPDNESATTSAQSERRDRLIYQTSATSGATPAVQNEATFGGFTTDGFVVNWLTNDGAADIWHAIVFGGAIRAQYVPVKITVPTGSTQAVTGLGFEPECFVLIGGAADWNGTGDYDFGAPYGSIHGFGFSNASENLCGWTVGFGTAGAAVAYRGQHDDLCASIRVANLTGLRDLDLCGIRITDTNADGFVIARVAGPPDQQPVQHILALRGVTAALGSITSPAATGAYSLTLPFEPELLLMQSHNATTATADGMCLGMGAWDPSASGAVWIGGTHAANPSVYARSTATGKVLEVRSQASTGSSSAVVLDATVTSVSGTGAELNFATVPATAVPVLYMAFAASGSAIAAEDGDPGTLVAAELIDKSGDRHQWAEVDLNDPDTYYGGYKAPRIIGLDPIRRSLSDAFGRLDHASYGVTLSDTDRALRGLLGDDLNQYLGYRPLAVRTVSDDDRRGLLPMRVEMAGHVAAFKPEDGFRFKLQATDWLKARTSQRKREAEPWQDLIERTDFPTVPEATYRQPCHLIYGRVSDELDVTLGAGMYPRDTRDPGWREFGYNGWASGSLSTKTYYVWVSTITASVESTVARSFGFSASGASPAFHVRLLTSHIPDLFRFYLSDHPSFQPFTNPLVGSFARYIDVDPTTIPTTVNPYGGTTGYRYYLIDSESIGSDYEALVTAGGGVPLTPPRGAVPTTYVGDTMIAGESWGQFLICRYAIKNVLGAFAGGVRITTFGLAADVLAPFKTDYATTFGANYRDINGRRYTILYARNAIALHAVNGEAPITANVDGYETVGDTTGTLMTTPALQCYHFERNFASRPPPNTLWATSTALSTLGIPLLDEASYAAVDAILSARITGGYISGAVIGANGVVSLEDVIADFCRSGDFDHGFDRQGRAFITTEPTVPPDEIDVTRVDDIWQITSGSFGSESQLTRECWNVIPIRHTRDYTKRTTGGWFGEGESRDADSIEKHQQELTSTVFELPLLRSNATQGAATIVDVVQRKRLRYRHPKRLVTLGLPYLEAPELELGQVLRIDHIEGPAAAGWVGHDIRVEALEVDLGSLTKRVTGYDLQPIYDGLQDAVGPSQWAAASAPQSISQLTAQAQNTQYETVLIRELIETTAAALRVRTTVRVATTANLTVATDLNTGDVVDGVTLAAGDVVLVKNQSTASGNGIYIAGSTPARSTEYDAYNDHPGMVISVQEGTVNGDTLWLCTSNRGGTLGASAIVFVPLPSSAAPADASYVTIGANATLSAERVLTGTTNQIAITDGGPNSTVTLSTPQDLHTGAVVQFARTGLATSADASAKLVIAGQYFSPEVVDTMASGAATINWDTGTEHILTLTGNVTLTFSNPKSGGRYVLLVKQDGTGGRTVTWPSVVRWPGGTAPTLTATANRTDLVTFLYSGTLAVYVGNYALNFS